MVTRSDVRIADRLTAWIQAYLIRFYRLMLWLTEREIIIARSTGRDPQGVLALRQDEDEYRRCITRLELGL